MNYSTTKRRSTSQLMLLVFISSICFSINSLQAQSLPTHFISVWQGENGQEHMNILVVSAVIENQSLSANDEIAVFSGSNCVGAVKLTQAINPADNTTFVNILASQSDGGNNGFVENDPIVFKIWDDSSQKEVQVNAVSYKNDISSWLTTGLFSAGASSVVEIASNTGQTQTIQFIKGNNLFSTYLIPSNPDVTVVMKSLSDQGYLISMQDESGNSYAYSTKKKVWINAIGSIQKTEGYLINLASNCNIQISGKMIDLPLDIPLKTGWNYISFPRTDAVDAMKMVQPLIDQNKLIKVQDEKGNSIEKLKRSGVWINNIVTFYPGKAYKINVSSATILTIQ